MVRLDGLGAGAGVPDLRVERWLRAPRRRWRAEMGALRGVLLDAGLDEALRWKRPCYLVRSGTPVAILQDTSDEVRLSFFDGARLDDPEGRLAGGPGAPRHLAFVSVDAIALHRGQVRTLAAQAATLAAAGRRAAPEVPVPDELESALADPALRAAWKALTPGRRRGWCLEIAAAKRPATRTARVERHRGAILAGRGPRDR